LTLGSNGLIGEYQDRRNLTKVDCSQTIWILATNAHDAIIGQFCSENSQALFVDEDQVAKLKLNHMLSEKIKEDFLVRFDVSLGLRR
jgi:hypothetical protein